MSEIKFRVFDRGKESLGWQPRMSAPFGIFDFAVHFPSDGDSIPLQFARDTERFELMQYIGLKDKNGIEIYEGDILKKMGPDYSVELDPDDEDATFPVIELDRDVATMARFPCFWLVNEAFGYEGEDLERPDEWEIIGNVWQNPELLEAK